MLIKSLLAFLMGGILCIIAQILIDKTSLTPAKILVSFVIFGVILGAVGVYPMLFEYFGCGVSVPLIGFGGNIAKGVREAVLERGIFGVLGGALSAASVGCTVALLSGLISSLFFNSKSKRL